MQRGSRYSRHSSVRGNEADGSCLSVQNLREHNANPHNDDEFAHSQFRQEDARRFQHFLIGFDKVDVEDKDLDACVQGLSANASAVDQILQRSTSMYGSAASSTLVMDRFSVMSPQNEPTSRIANRTMEMLDIPEGTTPEATKYRLEAARVVGATDAPARTLSARATASDKSPSLTESVVSSAIGPSSGAVLAQQGAQFDHLPKTTKALEPPSLAGASSPSSFSASSAVILPLEPLDVDESVEEEPCLDIFLSMRSERRAPPRIGAQRVGRGQAMRESASHVSSNGVRKRRAHR